MTELSLPRMRTQRDVRKVAFAERVLQTADVGQAYRDVFHPGKDLEPHYLIAGNRLLEDEDVAQAVASLAEKALVESGVGRRWAIGRIVETLDADLTDYADESGSFMDLAAIKANLPPEKRRLIRKYRENIGVAGNVTSRTIELEPKQPAMELLARILSLVQPASVTVNNTQNALFVGMSNDQLKAEIQRRLSDPQTAEKLGMRPVIEHAPQ